MARKLKSPTRTISNRGELPKFIGQFPYVKTESYYLVFDSLAALLCGIYLEWRQDVVSIEFEPHQRQFDATAELAELTCFPDYEVILDTGEIELDEAKYDEKLLSEEDRTKLKLTAAHCKASGIPYHVVFRKDLEKDGRIQTIQLLRKYGQLPYLPHVVAKAESLLSKFEVAPLETWRERARHAGISTGLLYHLLYHQRLPLTYRSLIQMELLPCRV